jgi:hypothetical protein
MPRHANSRSWTPEQILRLKALVSQGVSPNRASVALKRPVSSIRVKARELGKPFPTEREAKSARMGKEAAALASLLLGR